MRTSSISSSVVVDDVDDVERFAVLAVGADVVQHLGDGPVFPHRDVVRGHQSSDRSFGIAEQLHRDGALFRRQQREQLPRHLGRELLEEHRAVVRRHLVEQRGDILGRHRFQQRILGVGRQVFERRGGFPARQDPEHEHLIFGREIGEHRREIARRAVAQHVAQPSEIARPQHGRELVGGAGRLAHELKRGLAVWTGQLFFHMFQGGPHDIAVMHVRPDGAGDIEPEPVNLIEVPGLELGRVRAELIRGHAAARMVDDEPQIALLRLRGALPRLAEQPRLIVGRQGLRFADVNLRRVEPQRGLDHRVEHVHARDNQQPDRAAFALGQRDDGRQQRALVIGRARIDGRIIGHVHADHADGHRDNVAIAAGAKRRQEVRHRMRLAHGHQEVPGPRVHLPQIDILRRQQLELVQRGARGLRSGGHDALGAGRTGW